jgi:chemotaxis protein methyltransferase CheR
MAALDTTRQRVVPSHGDEGTTRCPGGSLARAGGVPRRDYLEFCEGVRRHAGLDLLAYRRAPMEDRVRAAARRRGAASLSSYLEALGASCNVLEDLIEGITVGVTCLWRTPALWDRLEREVLPELARRGRVRIWSAGCANGAEAYTLAAVCHETIPAVQFEILATDLDGRALQRARAGVFTDADARQVPPERLLRWFACTGAGLEARPALKRVIRFERADLLTPGAESSGFDLVLCRNVAVYFNREARDTLHRGLARALGPGGYLVLGVAERVSDPSALGLAPAFPNAYRRR